MADFRMKLIGLAGIATLFSGMAYGQVLAGCTAASAAVFVAAEGTTEQVADIVVSCPAAAASTVNLSVYLSPAVSVTSATLGSGNGAKSETEGGVTADFSAGLANGSAVPANSVVSGVVSGSSVTFNNIAVAAEAGAFTFTITNIKINASQITNTSGGAPTPVTATVFIGGTNVTPSVLTPVNVAFATNGLANVSTSPLSGNSIPSVAICTGVAAFATASNFGGFNVNFGEGFSTAFKTAGSAAGNAALGNEFTNNTYTGYGVSAPAVNTATSGTRIMVVFNNIPANVTVYAPLTVSNSGGTITMTTSPTAAFSAVTGSTANGAPGATAGNNAGNGTYAALTAANGSATAIYEETTNAPGAVENYTVPILLSAGAAAVTAPSSAITATVSFAPIGSASNVPNFVSGSSTTTKNGNAFSACTTTLMFPFVTNQLGFDTGLAISNTSNDLLAKGGTASQAANQSGTCALTFFGASAPSAAVTTPSVATGTTYAAAASTVSPGFQGYMIANCNFLYAHGFAYVVYNLTQNNGAAMGYLADVLPSGRTSPIVSVTSTSNLTAGVLTSVVVSSSLQGVSSSTPESWGH